MNSGSILTAFATTIQTGTGVIPSLGPLCACYRLRAGATPLLSLDGQLRCIKRVPSLLSLPVSWVEGSRYDIDSCWLLRRAQISCGCARPRLLRLLQKAGHFLDFTRPKASCRFILGIVLVGDADCCGVCTWGRLPATSSRQAILCNAGQGRVWYLCENFCNRVWTMPHTHTDTPDCVSPRAKTVGAARHHGVMDTLLAKQAQTYLKMRTVETSN